MPRWVKVSLLVAALFVALGIGLALGGLGGNHGPGRHMGPDDGRPPAGDMGHTPPPGMDHGP